MTGPDPKSERLLSREFHAAENADAWRVLPDGAYAFFPTASFAESIRFVDAISALAPPGDEPDIDIRRSGVMVLLRAFRSEGYGLVRRDLDLARAIATTARDMGLNAEPRAVQSLSMIPGAPNRGEIMPFWQAVLGYERRPDSPEEDLVDRNGRLAPFWFEEMDELRADGKGSIHFVIWVPWDQAEARVEAGVAAGGRMVRRNDEENFWTLADPVGNEVDIATTSAPQPAA